MKYALICEALEGQSIGNLSVTQRNRRGREGGKAHRETSKGRLSVRSKMKEGKGG